MARSKQPPRNTTPNVTMGQHPDGSPWCMTVGFGAAVSISLYGTIVVDRREIDVDDAHERAQAMLAAVEWVRAGRSAQIETEAARERS